MRGVDLVAMRGVDLVVMRMALIVGRGREEERAFLMMTYLKLNFGREDE